MLIKIHSFLIELHEINYDDISEHSIGKDKSSLNLFPLKPDLRANPKIESVSLRIADLDCSPLFGRGRGFHYDDLELRRHNLQIIHPFSYLILLGIYGTLCNPSYWDGGI